MKITYLYLGLPASRFTAKNVNALNVTQGSRVQEVTDAQILIHFPNLKEFQGSSS
jgi:hypothetical protein